MTTADQTSTPTPSPAGTSFGLPAAAACAIGLLSTGYGFTLASSDAGIRWPIVAFEAVSAIACVFGVLVALGKIRGGAGITIGFAALALFIGTGLSLVTLQVNPRQIPTHPWFLARLGIAGLIGIAAVAAVLGGSVKSWAIALKGAILAAIGGALLGSIVLVGPWITSGSTGMQVAKVVGALIVFTLAAGLLCIGAHLVIKAFELRSEPSAAPAAA